MSLLWWEKYRPQKFEDVIGLPKQFKSLVKRPVHILLTGGAGCGKTTCARIFAREIGAEIYELNASDDRGIQVIRDKVKFFAQKMSLTKKVMFLDEADGMTQDAQQSLRRIMEQYSSDTIFVLTANFLRRIIDPIRSRCAVIEYPAPDKKDVVERLKLICEKEDISYQLEDLVEIVNRTFPDIRTAITMVQTYSYEGTINLEDVEITEDTLDAVFIAIKEQKFDDLRDFLGKYVLDYNRMYRHLYEKVFKSSASDGEKKRALLDIAERIYRNQFVADPEINFMACVYNIYNVFS